jgi:DNA polymerase-4
VDAGIVESMALRSLVVDFNSYFASVEQQLRPELRGRAIAVAPMLAETTSAIAASIEAKRFGVKTGTRIADARRMCPGIIVVAARPSRYVEFHERLVEAIESCIHVESVWSIDEVCCELTGKWCVRANAEELALRIKRTIYERVGSELRCSIGIAPNPFLAKTASDMQKPDGLIFIDNADLPHCLYGLELRDLCGIGRSMEERLKANGIHTIQQLCEERKEVLRSVWSGIEGERMWRALRGELVWRPPTSRSSIGHSHVLAPQKRNLEDAYATLFHLLNKAGLRLRKMGCFTGAMDISVRLVAGGRVHGELRFTETQDEIELNRALQLLWKRLVPFRGSPLKVGVTLSHLVEESNVTPSLFEKVEHHGERRNLSKLVDELNLRYGKNTVYFGSQHRALGSAPMRIAFNHVPDAKLESDA